MLNDVVVRVEHLRKFYGSTAAVADLSFEIYRGEIFGMVGPNGAGKTTCIECTEGLRKPDAGNVQVLGLNPLKDGYALRSRIGLQLQEAMLPHHLKVWEALELFASFYPHSAKWEVLLEQLGLAEKRNSYFEKLSGGQKQRLFIALALINNGELLFLDELTTGLDPQARRSMWDLVKDIRNQGKSIFLTTHFMDEAQRLCDRVAIIENGQIIALDSPENLIRGLGVANRVIFTIKETFESEQLINIAGVTRVESIGNRVIAYGQGADFVTNVVNALTSIGMQFSDIYTEQPNLEDVFLALTGREMRN